MKISKKSEWLLVILIPIWMVWAVGGITLNSFLWFLGLDYSNSGIQFMIGGLALLGVVQSAILRFMIYSINKNQR